MRTILSVGFYCLLATTCAAQFANPPKAAPPEAEDKQEVDASAGVNALFAALDADGDGSISKAELRKAVVVLRKLDTDDDGSITIEEFGGSAAVAGGAVPQGPANPDLDQLFATYDKNNDGRLQVNEVPPEARQMLAGADKNGDGAIDRQEMAAVMQNVNGPFQGGPAGAGARAGNVGAQQYTGRVMKQFDADGDGRLSPNEMPPNMRPAFQPNDDADGDGFISPGELQAVMARMGGAARGWSAGKPPGDANTFRDPNRRNNKAKQ